MLTYDLCHDGSRPLYEQLYEAIKADILSGAIQGGEKLPSKRLLSEHLNISKVTVETAYQQLLAEGYLTAREKVGYFAEHITPVLPAPEAPAALCPPLPTPEPAARQFPSSVWARLMRRVLLDHSEALLQPLPGAGLPELRNAIAQELHRSRGMTVSPAQILIGSGAEYFYNILIQLLGRDRRYGLESPGHQKIAAVCQANQVPVTAISLDRDGVSMASLRQSGAAVLHLSPSHQFPTGIVMPVRRRQELLSWVSEAEDRWLIEDDYDAEFRFSGRPIPTLQSLDRAGRVIYMNTFSRTIAPSLRISYLVLPPRLMADYERRLGFYSCTVPGMEQLTLALFLSEGYFEKHLNRMKKRYGALRSRLLDGIRESRAGAKLEIFEEDAGLHFILRTAPQPDPAAFCAALSTGGLRVTHLPRYYSGSPDPTALRSFVVDYGSLEEAEIPAVLARLEALFPGEAGTSPQ